MNDTETAQANRSLSSSNKGDVLPAQLSSRNDVVPAFFSADNFDTIVERVGGGGSVNVAYLVAFQEIGPTNIVKTRNSTVPRRKTRRLFYEDINIDYKSVHKTEEPEKLVAEICDTLQKTSDSFHSFYCLCSYLRNQNGFDQVIPIFKGWMLQIRYLDQHNTYRRLLHRKLLIQQYLSYFQTLAKDVGMPYVTVVVDVGAAMNALRTV